ncbi:hypothetical protein CA13_11380 [Planctomycetes bacterium CA13]|uniref:SLA1 homology domain-containing protein n=1 Tax=Novipirellula herctigrandis TaxID=2527986 RepID=A0A5C5YYR1_9BACT|nr:hypothetical protein CA13_11380 [Planctomycetes bacterium CA13]
MPQLPHFNKSLATLFLLSTLLLANVVVGQDGVQRAGAGADIVFKPLDLECSATAMEMSEDGKFIAITHQADNVISVYDVVAGVVTAEIESPAPRSVLFRGNQIIVASQIEGIINFYQRRGNDWALTKEWRVPKTGVVHLSAAGGPSFRGQLVVTCHGDGSQASYQDSMIFVTSTSGRFTPISKSALGTVSYDGKLLIRHESFNLSSGGQITGHLFDEYVRSGGKSRQVLSADPDSNTYLYQIDRGGYWIGRDCVMGGLPLTRLPNEWGNLVIADRTQKRLYVIADDMMTGQQLSAAAPPLGVRRIKYPDPYGEMDKLRHGWAHRRDYLLDHPEAATHDGKTSLFIRTAEGGVILSAEMEPFEQKPKTASVSPNSSAVQPMVPKGTAIDAKPRTWRSKNGRFSVVATLLRPSGNSVVLKREDNGQEIEVPFDSLSDTDNRYLERQQKKASETP